MTPKTPTTRKNTHPQQQRHHRFPSRAKASAKRGFTQLAAPLALLVCFSAACVAERSEENVNDNAQEVNTSAASEMASPDLTWIPERSDKKRNDKEREEAWLDGAGGAGAEDGAGGAANDISTTVGAGGGGAGGSDAAIIIDSVDATDAVDACECDYTIACGVPGGCGPLPPGAVVLADGKIVVGANDFVRGGPYHIIAHHCHHAANEGCEADPTNNTGILSCAGATDGPYGHTLNWTFISSYDDGSPYGQICLNEPQTPGAAACCWDDVFFGPTPDLNGNEAQACLALLCEDQNINPVALECGFLWNTDPDDVIHCADSTSSLVECEQCCHDRANQCVWPEYAHHKAGWLASCLNWCAGTPDEGGAGANPGAIDDGSIDDDHSSDDPEEDAE